VGATLSIAPDNVAISHRQPLKPRWNYHFVTLSAFAARTMSDGRQILPLEPKERDLDVIGHHPPATTLSRAVYVTLHVRPVVEGPKLSIDFEWLATMAD